MIFTISEDVGSVIPGSIALNSDGNSISAGISVTFSGRTVTVTLIPAFTIQYGQTVVLQLLLGAIHDTAGNISAAVSTEQAVTNNVPQPPASIDTVEITSDPGMDKIYATGEDIEVTATFDQAVAVSGTPRIELHLEGGSRGDRWAEYSSGTGTTALVFSYTVEATDESDTNGIAVGQFGIAADNLDLNGGTITVVATGENASLSYASAIERQRTPGQLGAAGVVESRDVEGRNEGDPDLQRRSRRRDRRSLLVHGQGGRHGRDAERIDGYCLRQPGDADAGDGAHLVDAGGDGELRRSHQRGRLHRHRGPGGQRRRLLHRPDGDQSLRRPGGLVGRPDLRPRSRQHLRHRRRGRGDGDLRRGGRHLRLPATGAGL